MRREYQLPPPSLEHSKYPEHPERHRIAFNQEHADVEARFAARQGCDSVWTEDSAGVIFENGAYYRRFDTLKNTPVLDNFREPPVDDLDWESIAMRLTYAEIKHQQAVDKFMRLKRAIAETVSHRLRGLSVPPLDPNAAEELKAMKAECDLRAERVARLKELKANHPEVVRRRQMAEDNAARHRAELQAEHERNNAALQVAIDLPDEMKGKAEAKMSTDMFGL